MSSSSATPPLAPSRWWRIMPVVFVTYSLAYLDRANFGLAAAAGMAADLHITQAMSSLVGSLFLLGYFVFQIPGAIYAERYSVRTLIIVSMVVWGLCAAFTGVLRDVRGLLAIRLLMGIAEAAVMPAMLIYISRWFTRSERSMANTLFMLGNPVTVLWMSVLSGYLIRAFDWRWMFIIEGLPAVVWGAIVWGRSSDHPEQVRWLTAEEKRALSAALAADPLGTGGVGHYGQVFRSRAVLLLCGQYCFWSAGVFGFILWLPSILKEGTTMGIVRAGWLSAAPYLVAIAAMLAVSALSARSSRRSGYVIGCLALAALAFAGLFILGAGHFWTSFGLLVLAGAAMYAPYGPFWAIVADQLPKNVAGGAMALVNSSGALGAFGGSYLIGYLNGVTGRPDDSFLLMAGCLAVATALTAVLGASPNPAPRTATVRP